MRFSIVYPTCHPGGYDLLADTLSTQIFDDFELLCVDDFPNRDPGMVKEYLEGFDIPVTYVGASKKPCFPELAYRLINAYNTGVLRSRGEYVIIYNDYQWIAPTILGHLDGYLELYPDACVSGIGCLYSDNNDVKDFTQPISIWEKPWHGSPKDNGYTFLDSWIPLEFELFFSAIPYSLLEKMNGFPECYDHSPVHQVESFMNLARSFHAPLRVDRELRSDLINHRYWEPVEQWHLSRSEPPGSRTFIPRANTFDLTSRSDR
jgi:hypothetical protein